MRLSKALGATKVEKRAQGRICVGDLTSFSNPAAQSQVALFGRQKKLAWEVAAGTHLLADERPVWEADRLRCRSAHVGRQKKSLIRHDGNCTGDGTRMGVMFRLDTTASVRSQGYLLDTLRIPK